MKLSFIFTLKMYGESCQPETPNSSNSNKGNMNKKQTN